MDVAAAVWAQRGMLADSADIYRWLVPDRVGASAALAAVTMIGSGDRDGAETMLRLSVAGGGTDPEGVLRCGRWRAVCVTPCSA